jgi:hypothetical protein
MEDAHPKPTGASTAARVISFLAGLIALAIGAVITLGIALAGAVTIGIAALVLRKKKRRLTRRGAWFASVGGTVAALFLVFGYSMLTNIPKPPTAAERAEQRARATQVMPDWLKAINPAAQQQTQSADSIAGAIMENKAVMVWAGLMVGFIAAALMGTIAGSFAWGGVLLLSRSFSGDWMPATTAQPAEL